MQSSLMINGKKISKDEKPFILAEVACSHDGCIENVKKMINFTASSGADGIQFQIFNTDKLLVPSHKFYKTVKNLEIDLDSWRELINYSKERGLCVFANILEVSAFSNALESGIHALKIHSADLSNPEMLEKVSGANLPVVLSTGGSTIDEIQKAILQLKSNGVNDLLLMHGFQAYPTQPEDSHLNYIKTLENIYNLPVGYQDHIDGATTLSKVIPLLAMAKGAVLLEKHITDDREREGTDYQSAQGPKGFQEFVDLVNLSWKTFGESSIRPFSKSELKYRDTFKKSIIANKNINEGELIKADMITFMRGEPGIPPTMLSKVIGRKATRKISKFSSIQFNDLI